MGSILENTTDSIWTVDENYQILYLNEVFKDAFFEIFGKSLIKGDNFLEFLPDELSKKWKIRLDTVLAGNSYIFDDSFLNRTNRTIQISFFPILSGSEIKGVTCFGKDITQNRRNEEELHRSNLLLKASLESQKDTILLSIDKDYRYMFFNQAHHDVMKYAYDREIEVGMNILECITDEGDRDAAMDNYSRALGGESHMNIRIFGDKNKEYYESFFNPIYNEEREIVGATALARNISERMIQERVLKKSERSLKEASATKDKFFSLISHDLRSPLASINSLAKILCENFDTYEPQRTKSILQSICESLDNTYTLLDDLLMWARSQNNAIEYRPTSFNLSELLGKNVDIFSQSIANKEIQIVRDYPEEHQLYADKQMISTINRNLISNAIKFSHNKGKIVISVTTTKKSTLIKVQDFGIGIPKDNLGKVFSIGDAKSTLGTNNEKGTGLGLIMCKEFAARHKGKISIESEEEKGTTVTVRIPVLEGE